MNRQLTTYRLLQAVQINPATSAQGLSDLTVSTYLVVVRKFFAWLASKYGCSDIAAGVKGPRRSTGFRKDPLSVNQVRELLNHMDRTTLQGRRNYAIVNLMLRTGLRTVEVITALVEDVKQQSGETVLWVKGKGRDAKDEFVLLTQEALQPIYEYLHERGNVGAEEPLFASLSDRNKGVRLTTRSISRLVKDSLRGIHLDSRRLTAHSLRHTFATNALSNGAPLLQVKEAMRHHSVETTLLYVHTLDRLRNGAERFIKYE